MKRPHINEKGNLSPVRQNNKTIITYPTNEPPLPPKSYRRAIFSEMINL
jgi:hypothetical protein